MKSNQLEHECERDVMKCPKCRDIYMAREYLPPYCNYNCYAHHYGDSSWYTAVWNCCFKMPLNFECSPAFLCLNMNVHLCSGIIN